MLGSEKLIHDMRTETISNRPRADKSPQLSQGERRFELALPVLVTGIDALGVKFEENTILSSISSKEAVFSLHKKVLIGTRLNLSLVVPKTLILENNLLLLVTGEVTFVGSGKKTPDRQIITTQLNRHFKIQVPNPKFKMSK